MNKRDVIKAMEAAQIPGNVIGHGEDWEAEVDDGYQDLFLQKVANVRASLHTNGRYWTMKPMRQAGLPFGTLDSAEQQSLF